MKKLFICLLAAAALAFSTFYSERAGAEEITRGCKSACLMDANSCEVVYEDNALEHMPIASVCKVMTLTLVFEAADRGKISFDDKVTVSQRAAGMGGSQVFLESGAEYPVGELIKSVIVCSANDSCVALSEKVAGSEENFVAEMNKKAEELGCADTLFANCTGLPKETQYSCARDVALMFANLIKHEKYFEYSRIWLEDFVHPDDRVTSMTNTNKLIRNYGGCDGGKTGFTNEAGFCLAATAKKDNLRLVSVVLGGKTSENRFESCSALFNYGFANFRNKIVLDCNVNFSDKLPVGKGRKESVSVRPGRDSFIFCKREDEPSITFTVTTKKLSAPLKKGDEAGIIEVYRDGIIADSVPLVCAEDVELASFGDNWHKVVDNWGL